MSNYEAGLAEGLQRSADAVRAVQDRLAAAYAEVARLRQRVDDLEAECGRLSAGMPPRGGLRKPQEMVVRLSGNKP